MRKISDIDLKNKRVLMRLDLNVPLKNGEVSSDARIVAALPTINKALQDGAAVMILAHLGRPVEGEFDEAFSLAPVAKRLSALLGREVPLIRDYLQQKPQVKAGEIALLENCRFNVGEKKNNPELAQQYADLCDVFVSDGFGVVHRAQASTHGVAERAPLACAGYLVTQEVEALEKILKTPQRPLMAIVGGAKVSTKLSILKSLLEKVDVLLPAGGIANTFLAARAYPVGASLYEAELIPEARALLIEAECQGVTILLPKDVRVAKRFDASETAVIKDLDDLDADDMILDVGPKTEALFAAQIATMKSIIWNGPIGVFEFPHFASGTQAIGKAIAASDAYSFAGGGDTIAAIEAFDLKDKIDYVSTGGGSMLEYLEGKALPGLTVLD